MDIVYRRDAYATNATVDEHFAGATLANTAFETAGFAVDAVAVDRESCLVKGRGDSVATTALNLLSVKEEFDHFGLRNVENGVIFDFIHNVYIYRLIICKEIEHLKIIDKSNNSCRKEQELHIKNRKKITHNESGCPSDGDTRSAMLQCQRQQNKLYIQPNYPIDAW